MPTRASSNILQSRLPNSKRRARKLSTRFVVPEIETIPRPPQTAAQFKADLTRFIAEHPGIPFPSVQAIAASRLLHPLHQQGFEQAAAAKPIEEDPETIEGAKNEQRYRDSFTKALNAAKVDAVIFPTWAQLPALNGDRNTPNYERSQNPHRERRFAAAKSA